MKWMLGRRLAGTLIRPLPLSMSSQFACLKSSVSETLLFPVRPFSCSYVLLGPERPRKQAKNIEGSPLTWKTVLLTVSFGSLAVLTMKYFKNRKEDEIDMEVIKSYGKPALGGDFELVDQDSNLRSNKDFLGKWVLIYFGFTHCPDICPEEMEKMGSVVDNIGRNSRVPDLQPIFISIDPDRDTPEAVKKYISDFHPNMIGLTGNHEQVDTASRAFRVYYSEGPKDEDDDYIVDHTVIMYLLSPDGDFCEYFGQNKSAGEMTSSITALMAKFQAE